MTGFFKKEVSAQGDKEKKATINGDDLLADVLRSVNEGKKDPVKETSEHFKENRNSNPVQLVVNYEDDDHFDNELLSIADATEQINLKSNEKVKPSVTESKLKQDEVKKNVTVQKVRPLPRLTEFQTNKIETENDMKGTKDVDIKNTETINLFLWDMYEDQYKKPGQLFLFGKTEVNGVFNTVCVQITNVEKCLYLLPRPTALDSGAEVTMKDVYEEFSSVATELGIKTHRCKEVTKSFAFPSEDIAAPKSSDYLMVRYSGDKPSPDPTKNYNTIAHIFGTQTSSIERFVIEKRIKGPSWITITNFSVVDVPATWSKLHIICSGIDKISINYDCKLPPPPISLISINIHVATNQKGTNEVVAVSCLVNKKFHIEKPAPNPPFDQHFCILSHPSNVPFPFGFKSDAQSYSNTKIYIHENETSLLSFFLAKIQQIDPDLVITQDAYARQLDILCARLTEKKVPMWSKIGRLKFSSFPSVSTHRKVEDYLIGRMVCDVKASAKLLTQLKSYDLQNLCVEILEQNSEDRCEIYTDDVPKMYENTEKLFNLIDLTMRDNLYTLNIMNKLNVLPLSLQLANITGNLMSYTLGSGRSKGVEFLLLHAFTEQNYIVPDKMKNTTRKGLAGDTKTGKKARYEGGMVLEPIKGFYDKFVLLMDFNSLYPSIIQEFNICFTTIDPDDVQTSDLTEPGILPRQIKKLVENRRQVKKLLKQPDLSEELKMQYDIRQRALKLTANSMYGCLGAPNTRFYAPHLAALITQKGREILMNTKSMVEKMQYTVVYGDTDSIMVLTNR